MFEVIITKEELYDKCENIEQLYDKFYYPLLVEYKELKKQLENCYCNRTDCIGRIKDSKVYDSLEQKMEIQQKEFIKYLEDRKNELARGCNNTCEDKFDEADDILQEYKSIIGVSDENNKQ